MVLLTKRAKTKAKQITKKKRCLCGCVAVGTTGRDLGDVQWAVWCTSTLESTTRALKEQRAFYCRNNSLKR